jgi:membrane protease YdiL (CAAX protease family)
MPGAWQVTVTASVSRLRCVPGRLSEMSLRRGPAALGRAGQAGAFAALVLAMALASSLLGGRFLDPYGWIPLAAALLVWIASGGVARRSIGAAFGVRSAAIRAWIPAITIPAVVLPAGYLVAWATGSVRLDMQGTGVPLFGITTVLIVIAASLEAIGEELGWRGFLLPRLAGQGRVRAGLASGSLWAVWHFPLIYIAAAYHPGAGPLYLVAFSITIVAMSFVANELRMASGSAWPAVVFHGAHNGIWFQLQSLVVGSSASLDRVGGESGIVPLALYSLVALWIVAFRPAWRAEDRSAPAPIERAILPNGTP